MLPASLRRSFLFVHAQALVLCVLSQIGSWAQVGSVIEDVVIGAKTDQLPLDLNSGSHLGSALANLGDLNGDGTLELAIGGSGTGSFTGGGGSVQIISLLPNGEVVGGIFITEGNGGFNQTLDFHDQFGSALALIGDLNGDGTDDLAVGADGDDDGAPETGALWILFLNPDGTVNQSQKISATSGGLSGPLRGSGNFGAAVAGVGDLSGDGIPDLIVGAPGGLTTPGGEIWFLELNADGTVKSEVRIDASTPILASTLAGLCDFGYSLANIGDLDGDGILEVCVGAPRSDLISQDAGTVFVLSMGNQGQVTAFTTFDLSGAVPAVNLPREYFGQSLACLGDLDMDGQPEIAVGASGLGLPSTTGKVWILSLDPQGGASGFHLINPNTGSTANRADPPEEFGDSLAPLGDLDGDGVPDLAAGTPFADALIKTNTGEVYLLSLSDGDPRANFTNDISTGCPPLTVSFTDTSTGSALTSWAWSFGDDGTSTLASPTHVYRTPGSYTVSLTVTGADGIGRIIRNDLARILELPLADFDASQTSGGVPLTVAFSDASSLGVFGWDWDFGDGFTSTQQNPTHTYTLAGTYDVSLTANCTTGSITDTKPGYIVVSVGPDASVSSNNGSGVNPLVLTSLVDPFVGATWMGQVDGGSIGATGLTIFLGYEDPLAGLPTAFGELLVNTTSPFVVLDIGILIGGIAAVDLPVPNAVNLLGFTFTGQVLLNNVSGSGQLTNRLDFILGT